MIDILITFIGASLLLYVLLGGSDYGAGILELFPAGKLREKQKDVINHAMGPVWEANHMWLILIVVILFMGFPVIFTTLMTSLHVPMIALLFGIVVRGAAFTFRHYDAVQEPRSQTIYTWLFGLSSLWTAIWLGIIAASLNRGLIDLETKDPWTAYILPWWGAYPLSVGIFIACIFVFLASVYLIGETSDPPMKQRFTRWAVFFNCAVVLTGGVVFAISLAEHESLLAAFVRNPWGWGVMALASLLFLAMWRFIRKGYSLLIRAVAIGQVTLVLTGWLLLYAPNAVDTVQGPLNFYQQAAPPATLWQLVLALLIGSLFIFPSLFYLFKIFKIQSPDEDHH
ncbi:MAG: cytochrome d ubiquinol oxidase subunit II [Luteolibacter sp.]